jgi:hypothetical protein
MHMQMGVEVFLKGLRDLGYEPLVLNGKADHVVIDYTVENGKFVGTKLKQGFIVPVDFPLNPPTGIHVAALIHPFQPNGAHPTGGIHRDQAAGFQQTLGGQWQYWSRPPANWPQAKKTVAAYMSHVWRLWDSQ